MPIRDIALTLFVLGLLPLVLMRPWIGILLWTWLGLMNPHKLTWGFAFNFQFPLIVVLTTMIGVLFSKEPKRIPLQGATVALILMDCWFVVTTLFATNSVEAWGQLDKVAKIQIGIFLTLMLMQSKQRIMWLVWVTALSIAFFGVKGGLYTLRGGGVGMVLGPPGGFIQGNTEVSLAITIVTPLLFYLAHRAEHRWLRWALYGSVALCFVAVIGSYSRGGLLALLGMGTFLWWKSRKKALLTLVIIPFVLFTATLMPAQWYEKMGTISTYEQDASAQGRFDSWGFALNLAKDRPLVGGGFETFTPSAFQRWAPHVVKPKDAHSIWFEVLGEHGFMGLGLFMLVWLFTWRTARDIIRLTGPRPELAWARDLAAMIQVGLIGYWVGGTFLGLAYFDLPYVLLALLVLTQREVLKEMRLEPLPSMAKDFASNSGASGVGAGARAVGRP
jgi:putative inorganic carbon (HCO3(-)) transporter